MIDTDTYQTAHLDLLAGLFEQMTQIAKHLGDISEYMAPAAPNWTHDLADFAGFDWSSIGATVTKEDDYGPATVEWRGKQYTRRSPQNKFGAAIWFSRPSGKTEDGSVKYERLITFRPFSDAEPISREAEKGIRQSAPAPVRTPAQPAPRANGGPTWPAATEPEFGPDPFDDLPSATTDPAVKQVLAKAANGNGKRPAWQDPQDHAKQQVAEEAAARAAFEREHALPASATDKQAPALTHAALDQIAAAEERAHTPTERPFKDQASAVQWACRFEHYRKDGKPDSPHAVGSLAGIIKEIGCKEKEVDRWASAWIKHVQAKA